MQNLSYLWSPEIFFFQEITNSWKQENSKFLTGLANPAIKPTIHLRRLSLHLD